MAMSNYRFSRPRRIAAGAVFGCLIAGALAGPVLASPPPVTNAVNVTACVPSPAGPPVITAPVSGFSTASALLQVKGTAAANETVTVQRNGAGAGTTFADSLGNWSIQITLVPGTNIIVAQSCQSSAPITVTYNPPAPPPGQAPAPAPDGGISGGAGRSSGTSGRAGQGAPLSPPPPAGSFYLTSDHGAVLAQTEELVSLSVVIAGGVAPYRVAWDWGDGTQTTQQAGQAGLVTNAHEFGKPGAYLVTVTVTDAQGQRTVMTFAVRVAAATVVTSQRIKHPGSTWPFVLALEFLLAIGILSMWEYERDKRRRRSGQAEPPPPVTDSHEV